MAEEVRHMSDLIVDHYQADKSSLGHRDDPLDEYFPLRNVLQESSEVSDSETTKPVLRTRAVEQEEQSRMVGEGYAIYRGQDIAGSMPWELERVVRRAAGFVGVETEDIVSILERIERRAC